MKQYLKNFLGLFVLVVIGFLLIACAESKVTMTYQTNGGTPVQKQEFDQGHIFSALPETIRTGHTFDGWYIDSEFITLFDLSQPLIRNRTVYAKWTINTYTITFESYDGPDVDDIVADYNENIAVLTPEREGYDFGGWFTNEILTQSFDEIRMPANHVTLYAKWQILRYDVTGSHIFEKENLTTHDMEPDGPSIQFSYERVPHGTMFNPVAEFEGYEFVHFVHDSIIYTEPTAITEDMVDIEVYYARKILTITFTQNPSEAGGAPGIIEDSFQVYYGDDLLEDLPTIQTVGIDYTGVWDTTLFINMKESVLVRAYYYQAGVQTVTFFDGGSIIYLATNEGGPDQIITEESLIWNLVKPGFMFLGWFDAETEGNKLEISDMKYTEFPERGEVFAYWQSLTAFSAPTQINIEINQDDEITISWTLDPATIESEEPAEYNFILNGVHILVPTTSVQKSGTSMTLVILTTDDLYDDFSILIASGVHSLVIVAVGDQINHMSSPNSST
ncbi:MAG: InlB B-repeat-containing protein, partial [Acholeplasmataceae bacterium]|nr:InlB B-repeat-containing protein [Acholeplasmataceae bacterium]